MHTACFQVVLHTDQVQAHYLTIIQLNATANCSQQTALIVSPGSGTSPMIVHLSAESKVGCNLKDRGLFCCLLFLHFQYSQIPVSRFVLLCPQMM